MIGKLGSDLTKLLQVTQPPEQQEQRTNLPAKEIISQEQVATRALQDTQVAQARRGDLFFAGSLQKYMLGSELATPTPAPAQQTPPVSVGTPTETGGSAKVLKPGSSGEEVKDLQSHLNRWREENNLPPISQKGVYDAETEQAVKDYQKSMHLPETGVTDAITNQGLELESQMRDAQLSDEIKMNLRSSFSACQNDPAARKDILNLAHDESFCYLLSPEAQSAAVNGYMQGAGAAGQLDAVKRMVFYAAALEKKDSFNKLSEETRRNVLDTMFYKLDHGGVHVSPGNTNIGTLATSPEFARLSQKQQAQFMEMIRMNPKSFTAEDLGDLLRDSEFQKMDPQMQSLVIDVAYSNNQASAQTGNWPPNTDAKDLINLMQDPNFQSLTDLEKRVELLRLKSQMPGDDSIL